MKGFILLILALIAFVAHSLVFESSLAHFKKKGKKGKGKKGKGKKGKGKGNRKGKGKGKGAAAVLAATETPADEPSTDEPEKTADAPAEGGEAAATHFSW